MEDYPFALMLLYDRAKLMQSRERDERDEREGRSMGVGP